MEIKVKIAQRIIPSDFNLDLTVLNLEYVAILSNCSIIIVSGLGFMF